jgi:hypothetical protein
MTFRTQLAAAAAIAMLAFAAPDRASALEFDHRTFCRGGGPDPYAYAYEPPAYYPYYGSDQWRPVQDMRYRYRYPLALPPYYSSWGYPLPCHIAWSEACRSDLWRRRR